MILSINSFEEFDKMDIALLTNSMSMLNVKLTHQILWNSMDGGKFASFN